jgi:hypothetical protein
VIALIAYSFTVVILSSYAISSYVKNPRVFDWGNAICFLPLMWANAHVGAWWAVFINLVFGIIGVISLIEGSKREVLPDLV